MQKYMKAITSLLAAVAANVVSVSLNGGDIYDPKVWFTASVMALAVGGVVYKVPNKINGKNVQG